MPDPFLIPCLVQLRAEFNLQNPKRDKDSDGWIGDVAHQTRTSDHNPRPNGAVLAIDVDTTGPWPRGNHIEDYISHIREREDMGEEARLEYMISNGHIASIDSGWAWVPYDGEDPHTNHVHFSARHDHVGQNSTVSWQLEKVGTVAHDPLDATDLAAIATKLATEAGANPLSPGTFGWNMRALPWKYPTGKSAAGASFLNDLSVLYDAVQALEASVGDILELVQDLNHDPADGGPSEIQESIGHAVWMVTPRTLTA